MTGTRWGQRFFSTTRGRIIRLLRRTSRTVDELAEALDLTDNAIRSHLAALERDGLARQQGVRRRERKPAFVYELTPEADALFPKPYAVVLRHLLSVLADRHTPRALEEILREVGRRIGAEHAPTEASRRSRIEHALALVEQLGGIAELEERDDALVIRSYGCPLAPIVADHPATCSLLEALLTEVTGLPVREQCERDPVPRCGFAVGSV